jgi:predicted RNA-binding protein with PUA-like domain
MPHWLLKSEPSVYSFDQFTKEKTTDWTGVKNAQAQIHLRAMRKGDTALIYHSNDDRAIVGTARVTADPRPDPEDPKGKWVLVNLKATGKLKSPVTLAQIKADPAFAQWELVRQSRLSVMPVPDDLWARIATLADG